jgi:adenylate cyclase
MSNPEAFGFGSSRLMSQRRELLLNGDSVQLGSRAFDLLLALVKRHGQLATKDELMAEVWPGTIVEENSLHAQISALRKVLAGDADSTCYLQTIPGRGYRFVASVEHVPVDPAAAPIASSAGLLPLPDKPSIAVLAFTNMSGDPGHEYFADGMVEDIITELSRFRELFVIARNSSFQYKGKAVDVRQIGRELGVRYVLDGSVRWAGDRIRISAQLVDAVTGGHRWAERYDRELKDVFAVQDEIVRTIVSIFAAHVKKAETERTLTKPPTTWQAYDYCLQAANTFSSYSLSFRVDELYETRRLLQHSLSIDPNYARSYALLSHTYATAWVNPLDGDFLSPAALDKAYQLARKAVRLDANLPQAHSCLGVVLDLKQEYDNSIAAFERAIVLNPNYSDWRFGLALVYAGNSVRAMQILEAYMRLDPFSSPLATTYLGAANYMLKRYAEALTLLREYVSTAPEHRSGRLWLAAAYAQSGQLKEAHAEIEEILRVHADFTIYGTVRRLSVFKYPQDTEHYYEGLRKAGLPEK